jgi:hypothetical protein
MCRKGARWHCKGGRWHRMGANQLVHMAPIWYTQLAHGPHTSHAAPKWCHLSPMGYAGHIHMQLPSGTIRLAPGAHSSHMVHAAPIWNHPPPIWLNLAPTWCPLLSYIASSHVVPMLWMQLSSSGIRLPYGARSSHMALCGACGSYLAHRRRHHILGKFLALFLSY